MAHKQKKIQDNDWLYNFLRHYVDFVLKLSYREIKYVGRESIPKDGAVIYAPNHTNALMDALVILAIDHSPKVFVARADIFRYPLFAKILRFLKIMPIMRIRDGYEEVKKNNETIDKAVDVLRDRVPFCIFPEGTHQAKYSSLPLSKGIFRIAIAAQEMMPDMPLYVVPVGLRYGSFFRFRSTVRVQIGEPINVGEFLAVHGDMASGEVMNLMRDRLAENIRRSIFHIPDDEDYDAIYEICATVVKRQVRRHKFEVEGCHLKGLDAHFEANNRTVREVMRLKEEHPALAAELLDTAREASEMRINESISLKSVSVKYTVMSRLLKLLFVLLTLPYTLPVSLLTLPIHFICRFLFSKLNDDAFRNSVRYLINLVVWPLLMIIYSVVAYCLLPWQRALPLTLLLLPAPIVAHEAWRAIRLLISDFKLLRNRELRDKYRRIKEMLH